MIACFRPHVISSVFVLLGGDQTDYRYVHRRPERTDEGLSVPATQGQESEHRAGVVACGRLAGGVLLHQPVAGELSVAKTTSLHAISPGRLDTDPHHYHIWL